MVLQILLKNIPKGCVSDAQYSSAERTLQTGDRILIYTDGIVEAFNQYDEDFADHVLDEVRAWAGVGRDGSLEDDLTMIVIDVK